MIPLNGKKTTLFVFFSTVIFLMLVFTLGVTSCNKELQELSLTPQELTLNVGEKQMLTITTRPPAYNPKTALLWSSGDPGVATVIDGEVTAVERGSTTVFLSMDGKIARCSVTVTGGNSDPANPSNPTPPIDETKPPQTIIHEGIAWEKVFDEEFETTPTLNTFLTPNMKVEEGVLKVPLFGSEERFQLNFSDKYNLVRVRFKANASYQPHLLLNINDADIVYCRENPIGKFYAQVFDAPTWGIQTPQTDIAYAEADKQKFINFDIYKNGNEVMIWVNNMKSTLTFGHFSQKSCTPNPIFKFTRDGASFPNQFAQIEYIGLYRTPELNENHFAIIPEPKTISMRADQFELTNQTQVNDLSGLNLDSTIALFREQLKFSGNIDLPAGQAATNVIELQRTHENKSLEWYHLDISTQKIVITAKGKSGFFYAFQTLLQILPPEVYSKTPKNYSKKIDCAVIEDEPRFEHRGIMVDCSRHFFPLSTLKQIIDETAKLKMNRFHWHLTDDGGYRFPFEGKVTHKGIEYDLSAFTAKTSHRTGTTPNSSNYFGSWNFFNPSDPTDPWYSYASYSHGGVYSKAEIQELIHFAKERGVIIIPELDLPGHSKPLYSYFPQLRCDNAGVPHPDPGKPNKHEGTDLCAAEEATIVILSAMLEQVAATFECEVLHIGGDEVKINNGSWYDLGGWWFCSKCHKKVEEITGSTAITYRSLQKLQSWFMTQIQTKVNALGKEMGFWNETIRGDFQPNSSSIMWYWNGLNDLGAAKAKNIRIINSDTYKYYIDYYQSPSDRSNKNPDAQDWGGTGPTLTMRDIYQNDPTKEGNGQSLGSNLIGIQCNMWCEKITGFTSSAADEAFGEDPNKIYDKSQHLIYMIFPRVVAVAERAWSPESKADYSRFKEKVENCQFRRFDAASMKDYCKKSDSR